MMRVLGAFVLLGTAFLPAHMLAGEHSPLRLLFLRVFARWVEVPLLRLTYEGCVGRLTFLTRVPPIRRLLAWGVAYPFSHWGDTGRPIPHPALVEYIKSLEGELAVGPCRCRVGHRACGHPLETDIVIRTGTRVWLEAFPEDYRRITREEALSIVEDCAGMGMFHMIFLHCMLGGAVNEYVICNCCTDGCVPYIANRTFGQRRFRLVRGDWTASVDEGICAGCGECEEACPFGERRVVGGRSYVYDCYGCGLCLTRCPEGATAMLQRGDSAPPKGAGG